MTYSVPTDKKFLEAVNADDPLRIVVQTHQYLETTLCALLSAKLSEPHAIELRRLGFPLKVDLAIALGTLHPDSRPAWLKINSVRNAFAHDASAKWDNHLAQDAFNTLSTRHRKSLDRAFKDYSNPLDVLRGIMAALYVQCTNMIEKLEDEQITDQVLHEMTEERLKDSPVREPGNPSATQTDKEISERVSAEKQRRANEKLGGT